MVFNCASSQRKKIMSKLDEISEFTDYKGKWKTSRKLK